MAADEKDPRAGKASGVTENKCSYNPPHRAFQEDDLCSGSFRPKRCDR